MISCSKRSFVLGAAVLAWTFAADGNKAWAQNAGDWPARPVTIVVGFIDPFGGDDHDTQRRDVRWRIHVVDLCKKRAKRLIFTMLRRKYSASGFSFSFTILDSPPPFKL